MTFTAAIFLSFFYFAWATPTLYLAGDSTMARHSASEGIQGWGVYIDKYITGIPVVNKARSGRSARSYIREGRWTEVENLLKPGDYVVMEFGHNDGGSPSSSDRASVAGEGDETVTVNLPNGTTEVVHTFPYYLKAMIDGAIAKGATPIVSSQTPNNPYQNSPTIFNYPTRFVGYAQRAAESKNVSYVDHFEACIQLYTKLGKNVTESFFPYDHTHTSPTGANYVARAFVSGLKCASAGGALLNYQNSTEAPVGARC